MSIRIGSPTLIAAGALLLVAAASVAAGLIAPSQVVWLGLLLICPLAMFFMMRACPQVTAIRTGGRCIWRFQSLAQTAGKTSEVRPYDQNYPGGVY